MVFKVCHAPFAPSPFWVWNACQQVTQSCGTLSCLAHNFPPDLFWLSAYFCILPLCNELVCPRFWAKNRKICLNVFCFRKLAVRILGIWDLGAAKVEHLGPVRRETGQVGWPQNYAVSLGKCWPAKVFRLLAT